MERRLKEVINKNISHARRDTVIPSNHLPRVHNASIVIHKVSAEAAKQTKALKWDLFWRKHDALKNTDGVWCIIPYKLHMLYILRVIEKKKKSVFSKHAGSFRVKSDRSFCL